MNTNFWYQKWEQGDIGFHENKENPLLVAHFEKLNLGKRSRVFLPLCGKTLDIRWLLTCGYRVVGAELSELAIKQLFAGLGLIPEVSTAGKLTRYSAKDIDILAGNIFDLSAEYLGQVNAIYDRAALVALPASLRELYTSHLIGITDAAPQLLVSYEYNQQLMDGPPFSVNGDEIKKHYGAAYRLKPVEEEVVEGGLKGKVASTETAWLLQKKA
ncbi:MAG: thiopurine S-methyltransferase [Candidatus Nitrotoga sp.]